jgi:hypothetical protein
MTVMTSSEIRQLADQYEILHHQLTDFYIQNFAQLSEIDRQSYDRSLKQFRKQIYELTAAAIDLDIRGLVNPIGQINRSIEQLQRDIQQVDQTRARIDLITQKIQGLTRVAAAIVARDPTTISEALQQLF